MMNETITIELTKWEIIGLIKSIWSPYSMIDELDKNGFGHYVGGFVDRWEWNDDTNFWDKFLIEQLFDIYTNIKNAK